MNKFFSFFSPATKKPTPHFDPPCFILAGYNHEAGICGCYPECRKDCTDRDRCLSEMPEYKGYR